MIRWLFFNPIDNDNILISTYQGVIITFACSVPGEFTAVTHLVPLAPLAPRAPLWHQSVKWNLQVQYQGGYQQYSSQDSLPDSPYSSQSLDSHAGQTTGDNWSQIGDLLILLVILSNTISDRDDIVAAMKLVMTNCRLGNSCSLDNMNEIAQWNY